MKNPNKNYFFQTSKGQKLFIQEWGEETGPVILFFHGFPGCSDHAQLMTTSPLSEGFRLIAMDRPGYGKSHRQKKITPLKLAHQLVELLDFLNVDSVHLLHVSGGAPYSLALAYLLKDRVRKISSVCGIAPVTRANFKYLSSSQKKNWVTSKVIPRPLFDLFLNRAFARDFKKMDELIFGSMEDHPAADQKVFEHPVIGTFLNESVVASLAQGPGAIADDIDVYSKPWGFSLQQIQTPITLWHGDADEVIHVRIAEEMSRHFTNANYKMTIDEGHYSVAMNYRDQILSDLLQLEWRS